MHINRQLTKRFGTLAKDTRALIAGLPSPLVEELGESILDFSSTADLENWLKNKSR